MANIKNYSDYLGESVELAFCTSMDNKKFSEMFPGVKGIAYDGYSKWAGKIESGAQWLPVTRKIEYKKNPSKHECNAKCLNGKHNGTCECKCNGKNHGAGMFTRMLQAA